MSESVIPWRKHADLRAVPYDEEGAFVTEPEKMMRRNVLELQEIVIRFLFESADFFEFEAPKTERGQEAIRARDVVREALAKSEMCQEWLTSQLIYMEHQEEATGT